MWQRSNKLAAWPVSWLISACASNPVAVPVACAPPPQAPSALVASPTDQQLQQAIADLQAILDQVNRLRSMPAPLVPVSR